jgi:hypothetical protein
MLPITVLPNSVTLPANELSVQPTASVQTLLDQLAELVPGQRVLAQVQSSLGNGVYRAMVSQREVTLALPFAAKTGDQLQLEVVSRQGKTMLAVVPQDAAPPTDSTPLHLSRAGQTIGNLISHYQQNQEPTPLLLKANQPLVFSPPNTAPSASELAPALQQAIEQSGVFYESHLARWSNGTYPEALLRQEPQAQYQGNAFGEKRAPQLPDSQLPAKGNPLPPSSGTSDAPPALNTLLTTADKDAESASHKPLIPAALSNIVEQQIATLDQPTLLWHGQAWPGQNMDWEISREAPDQTSTPGDPSTPWRSKLTLHLPHLGTVEAVLHLDGQRNLSLQLTVSTVSSQDILEHGAQQLRHHLQEAGLVTTRLGIDLISQETATIAPLPESSDE